MKKISLYLFRFSILFEICWGAHAWFTWWANSSNITVFLTLLALAIVAMVYSNNYHIKLKTSNLVVSALFFYLLGYLFSHNFGLQSVVHSMLALYPIWVLISDNPQKAKTHLHFTVRILYYILALGIIEYFVFNIYTFPTAIIQYGENNNYTFLNYGFYLHNIGLSDLYEDGNIHRFASVFLEPGYLSAMLVFLLYALNFDFSKRENRVLLNAILLSFSLAGYIMLIIAFTFHRVLNRKSIKGVLVFFSIIALVYFVAINYKGGNNYLNSQIVQRLNPDEEHFISGNNRTTEMTRDYFYRGLENGEIILGLGIEEVERINVGRLSSFEGVAIAGTGAVYYFVVHGILAAFLFLLFYIMIALEIRTAPYSTFFVLLIMICFVQASYPDSPSWIYPFILGLNYYLYEHKTKPAYRRSILVGNS